jgi:hypothetical protein
MTNPAHTDLVAFATRLRTHRKVRTTPTFATFLAFFTANALTNHAADWTIKRIRIHSAVSIVIGILIVIDPTVEVSPASAFRSTSPRHCQRSHPNQQPKHTTRTPCPHRAALRVQSRTVDVAVRHEPPLRLNTKTCFLFYNIPQIHRTKIHPTLYDAASHWTADGCKAENDRFDFVQ